MECNESGSREKDNDRFRDRNQDPAALAVVLATKQCWCRNREREVHKIVDPRVRICYKLTRKRTSPLSRTRLFGLGRRDTRSVALLLVSVGDEILAEHRTRNENIRGINSLLRSFDEEVVAHRSEAQQQTREQVVGKVCV